MKKFNNKGFSMVEILAVVVILGIISLIGIAAISRLVKNSRDHYYDTQSDQLVMAAKAYANDDRSILPKMVGGSNRVYLKDLKIKNYIKGDIFDQNKKICDPDKSYVAIFKKNKTDYSYVGYLNCPSCKVKGNEDGYCDTNSEEVPDGEIILTVEKVTVDDGSQQDLVKTAAGTLKMWGNNRNATPTKDIYSYSYKIYRDGVLVFSSGVKRVMGKSKSVNIDNKLTESVPGKIKVVLTVTNEDGFSKTVSKSYDYKDVVPPHCGAVTGEANTKMVGTTRVCEDTAWGNSRDVLVLCRDYKGSGCKMHEFSGHFTRDSGAYGKDTVYVEDLNGIKTPCSVFTCIDREAPTLTVNVYKRLEGKDNVDDYKNETPIKNFEVNSNDTSIHDLGWFNKDYDQGVFFAVTATDIAIIKSYKVEFNETGKYKSAADTGKFDKVASNSDDNIYKTSIKKADYLVGEGRRYIRFTVKDGAGNTSSISFKVEIDRTAPELNVTAGRCKHRTDSDCVNDSFETGTTSSVTADNSNLSKTINMKNWVSKGIKINYDISDKNAINRIWETNSVISMTDEGDVSKGKASNRIDSTNTIVTLNGSVSLSSVGKRQGVLIASDEAGNSTKVIINGYVANTCTVTYSPNGGKFNSNASNVTQKQDYDSYFGDETNGMRNAKDGYYNASRDYYYIESSKEWIAGTSTFDQANRYKAQNVCSGMTDRTDKTITLNVNWKPYKVHIKYNTNGGSLVNPHGAPYSLSGNTVNYNGSEFNASYNGDSNIGDNGLLNYNNPGALNTKNSYYHVDGNNVWYKNSNLTGTAFDQDTNYKASQICDAKTSNCTVTFYTGWKKNTCTINYKPGGSQEIGAYFSNNSNNDTLVLYKDGHMGDWPKKNGMRNARGNSGYYAAKYTDHVVQAGAEWYANIGGRTYYFNQDETYSVDSLCPNLENEPGTADLYVKWLSKKPKFTMYTWNNVGSKCEKYEGTITKASQRPNREYRFAAYKCYCDYSDDDSSLVTAKAYYKRHSSWKLHDCGSILSWNDANAEQRQYCFPVKAHIYYHNNDDGVKACNYEDGHHINEYVYQVCSNGKVYENKSSLWFHGVLWYWGGNNPYRAQFDYILQSDQNVRQENFNSFIKLPDAAKPDTREHNAKFTFGGSKDEIQNACKVYCKSRYGNPRTSNDKIEEADVEEDDGSDEDD